jgi:hypothetical protein
MRWLSTAINAAETTIFAIWQENRPVRIASGCAGLL